MFIEVRKDRNTPNPPKKKGKMESSVSPILTTISCITTLGLAIFLSLKLNPTDQGQTYEAKEIPGLMKAEVLRIKNDPVMPPQAKAIALKMLAAHGVDVNIH